MITTSAISVRVPEIIETSPLEMKRSTPSISQPLATNSIRDSTHILPITHRISHPPSLLFTPIPSYAPLPFASASFCFSPFDSLVVAAILSFDGSPTSPRPRLCMLSLSINPLSQARAMYRSVSCQLRLSYSTSHQKVVGVGKEDYSLVHSTF